MARIVTDKQSMRHNLLEDQGVVQILTFYLSNRGFAQGFIALPALGGPISC